MGADVTFDDCFCPGKFSLDVVFFREFIFLFGKETKPKTIRGRMEEKETRERREDIFSQAVRAGKRTYFFDVKATRSDQYYLTITESKRRFNSEHGKFFYEKHKIFLYKEDFEKFREGLETALHFIETGEKPEPVSEPEATQMETEEKPGENNQGETEEKAKEEEAKSEVDLTFEDLGKE